MGALGRRLAQARRNLARRPANGGFDFAANTNIIGHAGKTLAIVEAGARPYELTDELETVGPSDFCGTLFGGYTAHPKRDPVTGELHAVSYNPMRGNIVQYTVTGVDGKVRRTVNIRLRAQTMMHDFSLTEKYVVLYDLPVALDFGTRLSSRPAKAVAALLTRFAERHAAPDFFLRAAMRGSERGGASPGRHALPLGAGAPGPRRCDAARGHRGRHPLVRRERVLRLPSAQRLRRRPIASCSTSCGTRRCSPPAMPSCPATRHWIGGRSTSTAGKVTEERLDDTGQEFPRVDERLVGRPHRYGYAVGFSPGTTGISAPDAILKHDVATRRTQSVAFGPGREPGEFVFVPSTCGCRRGRRRGDGIRLRPVDRPQRPGAARRADAGNRRDRAPSGPCATRFSRQLGADRGLASPHERGTRREAEWHWLWDAYVVGLCVAAIEGRASCSTTVSPATCRWLSRRWRASSCACWRSAAASSVPAKRLAHTLCSSAR